MIKHVPSPSFIAEGSKSLGSLIFDGHSEVYGVVEGNISQQSTETLLVGRSGWVRGKIVSNGPVVIEGRVEGDVVSRTKIEIKHSATLFGSVHAPSIQVHAGCILEGNIHMQQKPLTPGLRLKFAA